MKTFSYNNAIDLVPVNFSSTSQTGAVLIKNGKHYCRRKLQSNEANKSSFCYIIVRRWKGS